jgi:hypothetical protein
MRRSTMFLIGAWLCFVFSMVYAQNYGAGNWKPGVQPVSIRGNSAGIEYASNKVMFEGKPINESHTVIYDSKSNALAISLRDQNTMPPNHALGIGSVNMFDKKPGDGFIESSQAASDYHYTCLLESHSNAWAYWFNFDWAGFEQKINDQATFGTRFQNVDTYGHDDAFLYSGTWNGDGQGSAWVLNYQESSTFIGLLNDWPNGTTRYRPIDFAIHPWLNTTQMYGAVAVADNKGFGWIFNADFSAFDTWIAGQWNSGRRIINVEVYHNPGSTTPSYAGISEDGTYAQAVWFNLDWAGYLEKFNENVGNGYRPIDYNESGNNYTSRYAGIWNSDGVAAGWWINDVDQAAFEAGVQSHTDNGLRPRSVSVFDAEEIVNGFEPNGVRQMAKKFELKPNYPNPFNPSTIINFSLPSAEFVTLKVYNIVGEEITTLVSDYLAAGSYDYKWEVRDNNGNTWSSGVYIYQLTAGSNVSLTRKMVLLK